MLKEKKKWNWTNRPLECKGREERRGANKEVKQKASNLLYLYQ
jgi:hypothetical protein